jgi:hypothetical protein
MPSRIPSNGLERANQKETSQPEPFAVLLVFTLFSQAFEDRHFTEHEVLFVCFERSTKDDCSAMFVVESTAAFCLGASGANHRTSALERGPQPIPEEVFIAKVFASCDERLRVRFPKQQSGYLPGRSYAGGSSATWARQYCSHGP